MEKTAFALMMTALCGAAIAAAPEPMTAPRSATPATTSTGISAKTSPVAPVGATTGTQADAATGTAGVTATCKDGTTFSGATKRGACSGHKGVKSWAGAMEATDSKAESKAESKERGRQASAPLPTAAAGGGDGKVWVNAKSNTYHCQTDRYYGKRKTGAYMTEAEAKAKGAHADHGKACV